MLASNKRFHRRNHVKYVVSKGSQVRKPGFSIRYVKNQKHDDVRVAVVVSKKVSKLAVKRNRLRRRVFEVLQKQISNVEPGSDIVVLIFSESLLTEPFNELNTRLLDTLKEARLIK